MFTANDCHRFSNSFEWISSNKFEIGCPHQQISSNQSLRHGNLEGSRDISTFRVYINIKRISDRSFDPMRSFQGYVWITRISHTFRYLCNFRRNDMKKNSKHGKSPS